jgi:hypothetical protein
VNPQTYLDDAAARLHADGSTTDSVTLPGGPALLGYQSSFRVQWMFTKMHLFTFVVSGPVVSAVALEHFAGDALEYAVQQKGQLRGLQIGVAAIAVLAGEHVEPEAAEFARQKILRRFGAFVWPAAVDLSTGETYSHRGPVVIGGVYSRWMRKRTAAVLGAGTPAPVDRQ